MGGGFSTSDLWHNLFTVESSHGDYVLIWNWCFHEDPMKSNAVWHYPMYIHWAFAELCEIRGQLGFDAHQRHMQWSCCDEVSLFFLIFLYRDLAIGFFPVQSFTISPKKIALLTGSHSHNGLWRNREVARVGDGEAEGVSKRSQADASEGSRRQIDIRDHSWTVDCYRPHPHGSGNLPHGNRARFEGMSLLCTSLLNLVFGRASLGRDVHLLITTVDM